MNTASNKLSVDFVKQRTSSLNPKNVVQESPTKANFKKSKTFFERKGNAESRGGSLNNGPGSQFSPEIKDVPVLQLKKSNVIMTKKSSSVNRKSIGNLSQMFNMKASSNTNHLMLNNYNTVKSSKVLLGNGSVR